MKGAILLWLLLVLLEATYPTQACQPQGFVMAARIKETDPPGTILIDFDHSRLPYTWSYGSAHIYGTNTSLNAYFYGTDLANSRWRLEVNVTLDAEALYAQHTINIFTNIIQVTILCEPRSGPWQRLPFMVVVNSVNEFPPRWAFDYIDVRIPEEQPIDTIIQDLYQYVGDDDVEDPTVYETKYFTLHPSVNTHGRKDGITKFRMNIAGQIFVNARIDFDEGDTRFALNVSVTQHGFKENFKTTFVEVRNLKDSPVTFLHPPLDCYGNCLETHYAVEVTKCYQGELGYYWFGYINAVDRDGDAVIYKIFQVSGLRDPSILAIDANTGIVRLTSPIGDSGQPVVACIIQATHANVNVKDDELMSDKSRLNSLIILVSSIC